MKKNFIKLASLVTVFAFGLGLAINTQKQPIAVEAAQHSANFADYTYIGTYYDSLNTEGTDGLSGTFQSALATYVFPKAWYTYSGNTTGTLGQELQKADEDPTNSSNMVLLYTRDSIKKTAATVNNVMQWNREHVWPQANSNNCWGTEKAGTDLLHLRPTYETTNSARGNKKYGYISGSPSALTYNNMIYGYSSGSYFEPIDAVKGDVARIIMYVWSTYNSYYGNKLKITDTFASYDTLLKWHTEDKPDAMEGLRNDYVQKTSNQKNRNPFVDHPEYAWRIFGDSCSASVKEACMAAYPIAGYVPDEQGQGSGQGTNSNIPVAGTYSVAFVNNSKDGDSEISGTTIMSSQITSNTLVASVSGGTKVFAGLNGLKLGSSKASGEISFDLKEEAQSNICKIEIESDKYGSDGGKLVVKLDDETITSDITPGVTYEENLDKISASTISISTTEKRAYLSKITITVAGEETQEPPVDNPPVDEPPVDNPSSEIVPEEGNVSEAPVNPDQPAEEPAPVELKGCKGSIIASSSLLAISALTGLSFIFVKRRHY